MLSKNCPQTLQSCRARVTLWSGSRQPKRLLLTSVCPLKTPLQVPLKALNCAIVLIFKVTYCEECEALFQDQTDPANITGPSFVLDFPTSMGVPQKALLTLPYGLMIGRSSIPSSGVGVLNHGAVVSPGMHFGPYEGEMTTRENAMTSDFSWEIYKGNDEYEYIDAARESHSNWMRYINCARNRDETNLLAVQYKDSILFHCCRSIHPGDELMVWPSSKFLTNFKSNTTATSLIFLCSHCQLSFTTEAFLQRHTEHFHLQLKSDSIAQPAEAVEAENSAPGADSGDPAASLVVLSVDSVDSNTCGDCGKIFKQIPHLRRHKLCVHSNKRPYCCPQCRRSFSQAFGLVRHQLVHRKQAESTTRTFSCAERMLPFPSVDDLQQIINERRSVTTDEPVESAGDDPNQDPNITPQSSAAERVECIQKCPSQRPQRLGAKSKISAITKLIAPKRRVVACKTPLTNAAQTERSSTEAEAPAAGNRSLTKYKWFSCDRCKRTYVNPEELKAHRCVLRQHKCGQCGATFMKPAFLKKHEQTAHVKAKSYSCERCGKAFTTAGNLRQHQKNNTCMKYHCTSEIFSCSFCEFSFTMKSYLLKHIKRHHPVEYLSHCDSDGLVDQREEEREDGQYVCPHCRKSCTSAKDFKSHSCFQQVKVLYLCTDCGKSFTNHYSLKQHQRIHTGEKPYQCPHCSKSFSYTGQLNVHIRTHTGEKPYLCTHCGESFRQSGDLKRHERKHTGVRPYSCPECCKSFSRPQSLKAHQMLHLGQKMFKCNQCGKSFCRSHHLRRHHQKMHL
uniref:PR domain zinc finger protein 1 n=1 Tax=Mola mola TaxID=94237 RepID=A0A3Q3X8X7_MOLML